MVLDALARRTVFSTLGNVATNLVLEFHGNTFFGLDPILLTWYNMSELRMYKPYIQDFSVSPGGLFGPYIKLHIRVDVDTMRFLMDNRKEVNIHADERDYYGIHWRRALYHNHRICDFRGERNLEAIKVDIRWFQVECVRSITKEWLG